MAITVDSDLLIVGSRISGLQNAIDPSEPLTLAQGQALISNSSFKDSVKTISVANVTIATPGASINGVTLITGDRLLLANQTQPRENTIYIFNGASTPLTIAPDADSFSELEAAIVQIEEGTVNSGTRWRQTQVNGTFGTDDLIWINDNVNTPQSSTTVSGTVREALQTEVNSGTLANIYVSPVTLAASPYAKKTPQKTVIGDGTNNVYNITHTFNTVDVDVICRINSGNKPATIVEWETPSTTSVRITFGSALALNSREITIFPS